MTPTYCVSVRQENGRWSFVVTTSTLALTCGTATTRQEAKSAAFSALEALLRAAA